ncbi:hypothetical protein [Thiothrix winogradskyi]|uniref:Uncharacterized protein n=1 Tax=Thiothrix winogradskyi TaxID=96472 RepID=A0ABY3T482_9GAMM|nr:hypothetical protein [Thiothrix winogradskyi]UJS26668.1 hypothetical protein L2Y54_21485 [Thiothrix winogradskyi]
MTKSYQDTVVSKVNILYEKYKSNDEEINKNKEKSSSLRLAIQSLTEKLQQPNYINGSDTLAELEAARNIAINMDCESLKQKIEDIEINIKNGNTEQSLDHLETMVLWASLLKTRLEYITSLEVLNGLYQDQKTLKIKFKKLANILEEDILSYETTSTHENGNEVIEPSILIYETISSESNASVH